LFLRLMKNQPRKISKAALSDHAVPTDYDSCLTEGLCKPQSWCTIDALRTDIVALVETDTWFDQIGSGGGL
jgi:hypothetical protein